MRPDIQEACGCLQVCAGLQSGCEAAIHAIREAFEDDATEAALLIDASNAFNSVKRECSLRNISVLCPALFIFLVNTYRRPVRLFVPAWKQELASLEGTTQGDPAAMGMYALSVIPLIRESGKSNSTQQQHFVQAWYADDGTGVGGIGRLREWWEKIVSLGPKYGYYAKPAKTILVVKSQHEAAARNVFAGTEIQIETNGTRHLGATLGERETRSSVGKKCFVEDYVQKKIQKWTNDLRTLSAFALSEPQAAYAAFTHGLKGKWNFLQRTVPQTSHFFQPLEDLIRNTFLPQLTGRAISPLERDVLALPARDGGLGIPNPVETADENFAASISVTKELSTRIRKQDTEMPDEEKMNEAKRQVVRAKRAKEKEKLQEIKKRIKDGEAPQTEHPQEKSRRKKPPDPPLLKALEVATQKGASSWLTALPLQEHNYVLNKSEFRDALALRYGWKPKNLPQKCACGAQNSVTHCLDCKLGGFVVMRHNHTRDTFANFLRKAGCKGVELEQLLLPVDGELNQVKGAQQGDDARMDVTALGFWGTWQRAFFDVRVLDPFAPSYANKTLPALLKEHEKEKKKKYGERIREIEKASFTPLVFTVSGGCGKECDVALKRLAGMISEKTGNLHSAVMSWMRTEISFTLLRSCIVCLRGWKRQKSRQIPECETDCDIVCAEARL